MLQLYLQIDDTVYDLYLSHKHPKSPLYKLVMPNLNFCIYTHPFKKSLFVADKCQDEKHLLQFQLDNSLNVKIIPQNNLYQQTHNQFAAPTVEMPY